MVGCEKPKKSSPDGTTGVADLELNCEHTVKVGSRTLFFFFFLEMWTCFCVVPGGSSDLQEVGVARSSRGGHDGILGIIFGHNLKLENCSEKEPYMSRLDWKTHTVFVKIR